VSSQESRRCAKFLRDLFAQHGAQAKLASGQEGRNPLVLAKFIGQEVGIACFWIQLHDCMRVTSSLLFSLAM